MSRGKTDFVILCDEDRWHEKSEVTSVILRRLNSISLNGHIWKEDILPGDNKIKHFDNAISDTDFVISVFEKMNISLKYIQQLKTSCSIKMEQEVDGVIIPVFHGITVNQTDELIDIHPSLKFLTLYAASYTNNEGWEERLITKLTTPPLS